MCVCDFITTVQARITKFSQYDATKTPVFATRVRGLSIKGVTERYHLKSRYFAAIDSCSVKTVANKHRLTAYHNKRHRQAFQGKGYQHWWPWTTLNPTNTAFSDFSGNFTLLTFWQWIAPNWLEIDNLHMKFSALNVNFSTLNFDSICSKVFNTEKSNMGFFSKCAISANIH